MRLASAIATALLLTGCASDPPAAIPPVEPFADLGDVYLGMKVSELRELRPVSFAPYTGVAERRPEGGTILYHVRHAYTDHAEPSGRQQITAVAFNQIHPDAASAKQSFDVFMENWNRVLGPPGCKLDKADRGINLLWGLGELTVAAMWIGPAGSTTPPTVRLRVSRDTADLLNCRGLEVE